MGIRLNHELRGACQDDDCPQFGWCHCGCGKRAKISDKGENRWGFVKGKPRQYVSGHSPASRANMGFKDRETGQKASRRRWESAIPVERVRPLAQWLIDHYGIEQTFLMLGITRCGLYRIAHGKHQRFVTPRVAARISQRVLELKPLRIASPLETWELPQARMPTLEEREAAAADELERQRERDRIHQRRFRAGQTKKRAKSVVVDKPPICEKCGEEIKRKKTDHAARWMQRRYCSRECMHKAVGNISYGKGVAS